jgi:hypothetical protein
MGALGAGKSTMNVDPFPGKPWETMGFETIYGTMVPRVSLEDAYSEIVSRYSFTGGYLFKFLQGTSIIVN